MNDNGLCLQVILISILVNGYAQMMFDALDSCALASKSGENERSSFESDFAGGLR